MIEVLIAGFALDKILADSEDVIEEFFRILMKARAVIIYRASPLQKSEVVRLIQKYDPKKLTLAIGDGYNDVNMLQKAHIGIGILGKESSFAAAFADFGIPTFKDLRRMMFWHGRSYGLRVHYMIFFEFYKQYIRAPTSFFGNLHNNFSGIETVDGIMMSLYSVCLTTVFLAWWTTGDYDIDQRIFKGDGKDKEKEKELDKNVE